MRSSNTSSSRHRTSLWQGEEGTVDPEQGGQTSPGTDSQGLGVSPPPLARRKAVPNISRLLWGGDWKNTLPAPKPSLLRRPLSCPRGTRVPQALSLALRISHPALPRRAALGGAACRQTPCSVPSAQAPREGTLALWEVAAPVHPPLPGFNRLLGHPSVTSPSHPRPRGLCGAPHLQGRNGRGSGEAGALTWPADPLHSGGSQR